MHAAVAVSGQPDKALYERRTTTVQGRTVHLIPITKRGDRLAPGAEQPHSGDSGSSDPEPGEELPGASASDAVGSRLRFTLGQVLQAGWTGIFLSRTVRERTQEWATTLARLQALKAEGKTTIHTDPRVRRPTHRVGVVGAGEDRDDSDQEAGQEGVGRRRRRDRSGPLNPSEVALLELTQQCSQRLRDEIIHFIKHPHLEPGSIRWNTGKEMLDDALKGLKDAVGLQVEAHTFTDGTAAAAASK
jgi:hypothetical protein